MDRDKLIKIIVYIIVFLLFIVVAAYGIMTSDFSKIKKYNASDQEIVIRKDMPISKEKQALAKAMYYSTKVKATGDGMLSLGDFTMNLSNNKILTANISIKYKDNDNVNWFSKGITKKEMLKKSDVLRNAVISAMYDSTERSNSDKIKNTIKDNINSHLSNGEIEEIYFNKFIIK